VADPIDLTLERLTRLEAKVDALAEKMDKRLDGIESALGKIVTVLEAHDQRLEAIVGRLDRLMEQTIRARSEDAARLDDLNRRLERLERDGDRP
jgi:DNA anti-recombination protein RmuC